MRELYGIIILLILTSCSPFKKNRVDNYEQELIEIFNFMKEYDNVSFEIESDERLSDYMRRLKIDYVIKNANKKNPDYIGFIEENDSLMIFIKRSYFLSTPEKRIIYDFAETPRNFKTEKLKGAAYEIEPISNRWYFSTIGYD